MFLMPGSRSRPPVGTGWNSYTPVVTAVTGSAPTYTINSARFKKNQKTVLFHTDVTITSNGTSSGHLIITLPFTARNSAQVCFGQEVAVTGKSAFATIGAAGATFSQISCSYFDNSTIFSTSVLPELVVSGHYESA